VLYGPRKRKKGTDLNSGGGPRDAWTKKEHWLWWWWCCFWGAQTKNKDTALKDERRCGALGDLDKEKTHCSLSWEIEKLDKMLVVLWGVGGAQTKKRHTAL
jgi:hypothetical protein